MALDVGRGARLDLAGLFTGLAFDEMTILEREHVDWEDFAILCDRLTERAGGLEALRLLLDANLIFPELGNLVGALVSPLTLSRMMHDVAMPAAVSTCRFQFEAMGPDRFQLRLTLKQGARPCLTWFIGYLYGLRSTPRHLGLPAATVMADVGPTHGFYDVRLPKSRDRGRRVVEVCDRLLVRLVVGRAGDGTVTSVRFGNVRDDSESRLAELAGRWALTPRQCEVLVAVARGESNKEIAASTDCAENTVEFHVTQLLRKAGVSSRGQLIAEFWSGAPALAETVGQAGHSVIVEKTPCVEGAECSDSALRLGVSHY